MTALSASSPTPCSPDDAPVSAERETVQRYQTIINSVLEGIITVTPTGKVTDANQAALKILKCASEKLLNRSVDRILADPQAHPRHKLLNLSIRIQDGHLEHAYVELTGRRASGEEFPMEVTVSPAVLEGEQCFLYIFRDISRRRDEQAKRERLEQSLRDAHKLEAIAHLAGGVAHEINTPSQYIQNNLSYLSDGFRDLIEVLESALALIETQRADLPEGHLKDLHGRIQNVGLADLLEEVPDAIDQSLTGIDHIARIVSSLRETAHPSGSRLQTNDLKRIIDNAVNMTRNEWKYIGDLETKIDPELPNIQCHASELSQVLINLIVNGCHALEGVEAKKGRLTLNAKTAPDGDAVELSLSDNGPGVPEKIRDQIFHPFYTTKDVGKGTGQGLAICKDIICARHGGQIQVGSCPELGGAKFTIRLPKQSPNRSA